MNKQKNLIRISLFVAMLLGTLLVSRGEVFAATKTWDGEGSDDNFSTASNWDGDTAPVNGDSVVLPSDVIFSGCSGSSEVTLNNDLDSASVTFAGVSVSGLAPNGCSPVLTVSGNEIKSSGDIIGNNGGNSWDKLYLEVPLTLTSSAEVRAVGSTSSLSIGANNVTVIAVAFGGGVSGGGNLTIDSSHQYAGSYGGVCSSIATPIPFAGNSSGFSGGLINVATESSLTISPQTNDIARHASSFTSSGSFDFALNNGQDMEFNKDITLNGGNITIQQQSYSDCEALSTNKKLTISGNVTLTADTTFNMNMADVHFAGTVTGKQHIKVAEGQTGKVTFADGTSIESALKKLKIDAVADCDHLYSAGLANNSVTVNVDCTTSEFYRFDNPMYPLEVRGILGGNGKTGHIKVLSGGRIAPGLSPGTITVSNIEWVEGGVYEFEIGQTGADQIIANGTVTLGNGTLSVVRFEGYVPKANDVYTIIANDGADAVVGTFKDLPEGATFTNSDGAVYRISYKGGDGNDVTLTVVTAPKVPNTGFNMLKNNPILTLLVTSGSALAIALIARRVNTKHA